MDPVDFKIKFVETDRHKSFASKPVRTSVFMSLYSNILILG
jgi:hypothetical protein